MKGSSDRKGLSSMYLRASETTGTHLAHWPPPQRGKESKPFSSSIPKASR